MCLFLLNWLNVYLPCQRGSSLKIFSMSAVLAACPDCPSPPPPSVTPGPPWDSMTCTSLQNPMYKTVSNGSIESHTHNDTITLYNSFLLAPDIIHRTAQVMWSMCKGTVGTIFAAVAFCICFVDAWSRLIVAEVISALCVTSCPM